MLNSDYREMLQCLADEKVKFLVVGASALAVHGYPRATKDIDFFVWANPENAASLFRALSRFGAPLNNLSAADFASEGAVYQIGIGPRRIDIVTRIDGVKFEDAYPRNIARPILKLIRETPQRPRMTFAVDPQRRMNNSGWKAARRRAAQRYKEELGRECPPGFRSIRVHNLKHTFGYRLRAAGVSFKDRQTLLGHRLITSQRTTLRQISRV